MKTIPLIVTKNSTNITLTSSFSNKDISTQYDNFAQELEITRPTEYESLTMALIFSTSSEKFTPVYLGAENKYLVPNTLTQELELEIQVMFLLDGEEIDHTNVLKFSIRPSLEEGKTPIEPWPDPVADVYNRAMFTADDMDSDYYRFYNNFGDIVASLQKGSGGSGGTTNYNSLQNKPKINNIELLGNKTSNDFGLANKSELDTHVSNKNNPHDVKRTQISDFAHTHPQSDVVGLEDRFLGIRNAIHVLVEEINTQDGEISELQTSKATSGDIANAVSIETNARLVKDAEQDAKINQVEAKVDNVPVTYPFETFDEFMQAVGNADNFYPREFEGVMYPYDPPPTIPAYPGNATFIATLKVNDVFVIEEMAVKNDYYWNGTHAIPYTMGVDLSLYAKKTEVASAVAQGIEDSAVYTNSKVEVLQPKETGKGLSTNDYTNGEKAKLTDIEVNAINANTVQIMIDNTVGDINAALLAILGV